MLNAFGCWYGVYRDQREGEQGGGGVVGGHAGAEERAGQVVGDGGHVGVETEHTAELEGCARARV